MSEVCEGAPVGLATRRCTSGRPWGPVCLPGDSAVSASNQWRNDVLRRTGPGSVGGTSSEEPNSVELTVADLLTSCSGWPVDHRMFGHDPERRFNRIL